MLIEFGLPTGSGGQAAAHEAGKIRTKLKEWLTQYKITVKTHIESHSYRHWLIVEFDNEQSLTLFALTWQHKTFMPWKTVIAAQNGSTQ